MTVSVRVCCGEACNNDISHRAPQAMFCEGPRCLAERDRNRKAYERVIAANSQAVDHDAKPYASPGPQEQANGHLKAKAKSPRKPRKAPVESSASFLRYLSEPNFHERDKWIKWRTAELDAQARREHQAATNGRAHRNRAQAFRLAEEENRELENLMRLNGVD